MVAETAKNFVPKFFGKTASTYDKVARWTTLGKDDYWKKEIIKKISKGNSFLDLACGTGILTRKIAEKFPNAKIIGIDISEDYLVIAKKKSVSNKNISFIHQDAERLNLDSRFDAIISSYIPKYCDPEVLVKICVEHLNPGGRIILHDFTFPQNKTIRKIWNAHFVLLKFLGYFIPSWKEAFTELPKIIRSSNWLSDYESEMKKNALEVNHQNFTYGSSAILIGKKLQ